MLFIVLLRYIFSSSPTVTDTPYTPRFHQLVLDSGCGGVTKFFPVEFYTTRWFRLLLINFILWWYRTRPINITTKNSGKNMLAIISLYYLSHLRLITVNYNVKLPPFCNISGMPHGRQSSHFTTTMRAFVLVARNCKFTFLQFPSLASTFASNWSASNLPHDSK